MTRAAWTLALLCAALLPLGCVVSHGDFTLLSSQLVRTSDFRLDQADRVHDVVGRDYTHIIFAFPTSTPSIDEAIADALDEVDGDLMTDVTVEQFGWYVPLIYGRAGWTVRGDVVRTRR